MTSTAHNVAVPPQHRIRNFLRVIFSNNIAPIALALIIVSAVLSFMTPTFLTPGNLSNIVTQSSVVGIAAVGATFVIITSGIDLSVGANIALSGLLGAMVSQATNGYFGILTVLVVASLLGAINGAFVAWLRLAPFIVTLAVLGMARGMTLQISQGNSVYGLPEALNWLGNSDFAGIKSSAILTIVMFVLGHILLSRTTFGHRIYAVGGNSEAARLAGINVKSIVFTAYVIAGFCAGLAAIVTLGRLDSATPNAAIGAELNVIAAVVIGGTSLFGGKGSMVGTFIGVLLIGVINNGMTLLNVSAFLVQFVQGALILLAVLLDALNTRRIRNQRTS
ncbi:ABC transporter permease [Alpinimonas psychrophila]|uniref:Ribose/xylose/arabinose/galactoside ABC-type transport system permease subunit n=1 Tax=Alpinimonas psychrophila TaxID=748908 RepID=A0A7W3JTF7_9MICO|nr:ABC transporter permease [Alpinimonas psychrophila]MBA8828860.1 ribose/xylose/arabinose/galactoside ABC-type transport system permease subunit [Alpinimonas psychrophila]